MKTLLILSLSLATWTLGTSLVRADLPPKAGSKQQDKAEVVDPKKLMAKFDADHDGKLDKTELSKALRSLKKNSLTSKMLPQYDKDGDGKLNLAELTEMLKHND